MSSRFHGLIAAAHTPMEDNGGLRPEEIATQAEIYRINQLNGAFVCGTTGEGRLLSINERKRVAEGWAEAARGDFPVIVHVGAETLAEAQDLARHAASAGAAAVSASPPCYHKPASVEALADFCGDVAAAAPGLPFFYYHIPGLTGVHFPMIRFLERATTRIPTLEGIKYSHNDFMDIAECLRFADGRYSILFGMDQILLAALAMGAQGAVGSTYNYAAPLYRDLIAAFREGRLEEARSLQALSIRLVRIISQYNEIAAGKAIMDLLGLNCGPVRQPLVSLVETEREAIRRGLEYEGLDRYLCRPVSLPPQ